MMTKQQIDTSLLEKALINADVQDEDAWLYRDYGYRAGDASCAGIVFRSERDFTIMMVELALLAGIDYGACEEVRGLAGNARSDSLGHNTVYYWPGYQFDEYRTSYDRGDQ